LIPESSFVQDDLRKEVRAENTAFWMFVVPGGFLTGILYVAEAGVVAWVVGGLTFLVATLYAPSLGVYAYFALQALDVGFKAERFASFTPSKALAPFLLLVFLTRLGTHKTRLQVSQSLVWTAMLFGVYGLLTAPLATDMKVASKYGAQIIIQALLIGVVAKLLTNRTQIHRALLATAFGGLIASMILVVTGGVSSQFTRATLGEFANPNSVAHGLSISLLALPAAWGYCRSLTLKTAYFAAAPVILAGMMKTGSRSAIAAAVGAFAVGGLVAKRAGLMRSVSVTAITTLLAGGSMLVVMRSGVLDAATQERIENFLSGRRGDVGEERGEIWKEALHEYLRRPVFGFGYGNTAAALQESQGVFLDVHSSIVGPLVDGGPIGFTLFALTLILTLKCVRGIRQGNPGIAAAMMFCMLIVSCLTHTIHFTKWFWIPITICVLLAEQTAREREASEPGRELQRV